MRTKLHRFLPPLLALCLAIVAAIIVARVIHTTNVDILNPQGEVASAQKNLILIVTGLMLIVVIPVFIMTGLIAWKFREGNKKAKYTPDWDGNVLVETVWWGIPLVLISVLSVIIWTSSAQLDPFRSLDHAEKPIRVQVVSLQWKWLFIYPDYGIASVNDLQFPTGVPIDFQVTSDAPMNSFWIPSLGGQIYAMSGMSTELHLIANHPGVYKGSSANISGAGFADMTFTATAYSRDNFAAWVASAQSGGAPLDEAAYNELAKPSTETTMLYSLKDNGLYDKVVMKYMAPSTTNKSDAAASTHMNHEGTSGE